MPLRVLDRLEEIIIATLMGMATTVIFIAVVHRYSISTSIDLAKWGRAHGMDWLFYGGKAVFTFLSHINLTWAQELCIYMFVWMAKFGAAYGVRTGIHVGVDVAVNRTSPASRHMVVLFALMAGALFTFIVGSLGARFVWHIGHTDQVSADLEAPMWLIYLAVPLGSYLMCFRFLQVAFSFWRTGELPHHDHGHVEGIDDETPTLPGILETGDAR
ncbi:MAG: TRAP transporter small permease [Methylobacteriaceae bacterium]|nr:TRAP transporter small permease [Rhodoblastus sp.]MCB9997907.1 TRAP transporter small permease [Methylobacteriaceae bacterium]MCC0001963.1 TRAP transporter small permease [Methylobacteriaceae bacterium]MCC2100750.1 TRAP transporter small permease [Hyphomicrobiales bacterium]MCO5086225.1 TRAP transporter small permease [Methylobacteriaceae bacterium]